jgi:hypothetical protein
MPSAEVVASALLQLKNNPRLFEKWTELRGYTFKANGTMFRDTYQRTRDERRETVQCRLHMSAVLLSLGRSDVG